MTWSGTGDTSSGSNAPGLDKVVSVKVRLTVFQLLSIDTSNQSFAVDAWLKATWQDPTIPGRTKPIIYDSKKTSKVKENGDAAVVNAWSPMLTFHNSNAADLNIMQEWFTPAEGSTTETLVSPAGQYVSYNMRFSGRFSSIMDLKKFPFDSQRLSVVLTTDKPLFVPRNHFSRKFTGASLEPAIRRGSRHAGDYVVDAVNSADADPLAYARTWRVHLVAETDSNFHSMVRDSPLTHTWAIKRSLTFRQSNSSVVGSGSGCAYARLAAEICVVRYPGFYMSNLVVTLYFIISAAFACFFVDCNELAARCSITLTMFLTSVALKFAVSNYLPAISYLTYMDIYVLLGVVMIAVIILENCIASTMAAAAHTDKNFAIVAFVTWTAINTVMAVLFVARMLQLHRIRATLVVNEADSSVDGPTSGSESGNALELEFRAFLEGQVSGQGRQSRLSSL